MTGWSRVIAPDVPEFPAFAHAAIAGDTIHVSGMLGLSEDGSGVVGGGVGPETTRSFELVERILHACDATLADVAKVTVYMTDLADWEAMNEAYLQVFGPRTPARIAIGCASLLFGARVEFDCIAHRST
jgi:2-iminobutanoate/2-iminopropanoate deaminase